MFVPKAFTLPICKLLEAENAAEHLPVCKQMPLAELGLTAAHLNLFLHQVELQPLRLACGNVPEKTTPIPHTSPIAASVWSFSILTGACVKRASLGVQAPSPQPTVIGI